MAIKFTRDLYVIQQREKPITMNLIISASLLYYPLNEITFKSIKIITKNIFKHIKNKKYKTYLNGPPQNYDIEQAALNLGFTINGYPNDKIKGD